MQVSFICKGREFGSALPLTMDDIFSGMSFGTRAMQNVATLTGLEPVT